MAPIRILLRHRFFLSVIKGITYLISRMLRFVYPQVVEVVVIIIAVLAVIQFPVLVVMEGVVIC